MVLVLVPDERCWSWSGRKPIVLDFGNVTKKSQEFPGPFQLQSQEAVRSRVAGLCSIIACLPIRRKRRIYSHQGVFRKLWYQYSIFNGQSPEFYKSATAFAIRTEYYRRSPTKCHHRYSNAESSVSTAPKNMQHLGNECGRLGIEYQSLASLNA